jgi:polyribonucleotide nucleotidyltransferase
LSINIEFEKTQEIYRINELAKQSDGSALLQENGTVLLATVVMDELAKSEEDFLPLTVQYVEKLYAVGKIPSGFIKREGKPSDFETLTSRIVDRALRPTFPKGFNYPVQITIFALSVDENADLQTLALKAASAALFTSSIPVRKSISAVRIGKIEDDFVVNPNAKEREISSLDLFVAGSKEELIMIEMRSVGKIVDENIENGAIPEDKLIEAIDLAQNELKKYNLRYENEFSKVVREEKEIELFQKEIPAELVKFIADNHSEDLKNALAQLAQSERATTLSKLADSILDANSETFPEDWTKKEILEALQNRKREIMRNLVLETGIRADGRGTKDVRPISIETNILPQVHGSCLFTRGQTQALVTLTIGSNEDAQIFEELTKITGQQEQFMVHYNFPGFSVGEASRMRPVGRRELGHGNLAKRALESSLDNRDGMTVRLVSEILESNGSSSMATVCGGALALKAGGKKSSELISGVAMGLITEGEKYAILTDIMGLEDHDGDMDFKVTGSREAITALQMDIKLGGISLKLLSEALHQAKDARGHILNIMEKAENEIEVNYDNLPKVENFSINPSKIVDVLGQGGRTIKAIIENNGGVKIDINRETGDVKVIGRRYEDVENATAQIKKIADDRPLEEIYQVGSIHRGTVKQLAPFGAFVELPTGQDGMIHISKIAKERVTNIEDYIRVGEKVDVEILSVNGKKISLQRV